MPVLLKNSLNIRSQVLGVWYTWMNNTWQYSYAHPDIPDNATALIVQATSPYTTYAMTACLLEYYGEDISYLDTISSSQNHYLDNYDSCFWILAWRGPGTLIQKLSCDVANYVGGVSVIGYFTEDEFTPYDSRIDCTYDSGGSVANLNITNEPWYHPDATAYLTGAYSGLVLATKGWRSRSTSSLDTSPSIIWPDENNEVWISSSSNKTQHISGYFTCPIIKGEYPAGRRAWLADLKPLADADEGLYLAGETDPKSAFTIAYYESNAYLTLTRADITTNPYTSSGSIISGNGFYVYGGKGSGKELFILPDDLEGYEGVFDFRMRDHLVYNDDAFIEYVSFPRTRVVDKQSPVVLEQLQVNDPLIIENLTPSMALPLVYRTVSGTYTWSGTLVLYLSGGPSNVLPSLSLGGVQSSSAMGSNLFDDITNRKAQLGGQEYRCVYVKNTSASETAYGLVVWVDNQAQLGNSISLGDDPSGAGGTATSIDSEEMAPSGVSFSKPSSFVNGLHLGTLPPTESVAVWIRRDMDVQNIYSGSESVSLAFSVSNNG